MWTNSLRLISALFAVALFASACGGSTATDTSSSFDDTAIDDTAIDDTATDDTATDDESVEHTDEHGDNEHSTHASVIDVDPNLPIPAVAIELTETDTAGMFDLSVTLTNFTVTPDNVDGDPVDNEGHMHLLIDGERVERFYDLERQIMVPEGEHVVEVEINANNHSAYAVDGEPIRAGETVGAGEAAASSHDHGDHSNASAATEDGLTSDDATVSVTATLANGEVSLDTDDRVEASIGDVVMILVSSDVSEEAHLHGYDILASVEPGEATMMLFTADTAGKFELEFEASGMFIAELVVS